MEFSRQEYWSGLPFLSPMHESEKSKWSRSVVSDSSWPHGLQPTRLLRPWDFPGKSTGVGCHCLLHSLLKFMSIESVMPSNHLILCCPLPLLPSIFPSIRVFSKESVLYIRWPKYWSFNSASVLPMNIQDWFPLGWTGWISLQSKGLSRIFSNTTVQKHQFFDAQLSLQFHSHIHT